MGLDELVKKLDNDDFNILKTEFPDTWQNLNKKLAYPNEIFNSIDDYKTPVDNLKKDDFFSSVNKKTNALMMVKYNGQTY